MRMIQWTLPFFFASLNLSALQEQLESAGDISPIEALEAELADARASLEGADLVDTARAAIKENLDFADTRLETAKGWRTRAAELARMVPNGPSRVREIEAEIASVDQVERVFPEDSAELAESMERTRAEVARMEAELTTAESALAELRERPVFVGSRLPQALTELDRFADGTLAPADGETLAPRQQAELLRNRAEAEALKAEIAVLQNERDAQVLRERIASLRIQLLENRLSSEREWMAMLERRQTEDADDELNGLRRDLAAITAAVPADREDLRDMAGEMADWIRELGETADTAGSLARRSDRMREQLEALRRDNERVRRQIALGGFEGAFTQLLIDQRHRLRNIATLDYDLAQLDSEITAAQLNGLRIEEMRRELPRIRERWRGDATAEPLVSMRAILLDRLDEAQRRTVRELTRLGADQKAHRDLAVEFGKFLSDQLFWRRSSPPLGPGIIRSFGREYESRQVREGSRELWGALRKMPERRPGSSVLSLMALAVLLAMRGRLRESIRNSGGLTRRISTDRLGHTLRGLAATVLRALPVPLVFWSLSIFLASGPESGPWVSGTSQWLRWAAWLLLCIITLGSMAGARGIGREHFGWEPAACDALRKGLLRIMWVYLPCLLIVSVTFFDRSPHAFDSLGRLAFSCGQVGLAWGLAVLFAPSTGVFACIARENPRGFYARTGMLWFWLMTGIPLALILLAAAGYTITAVILSERLLLALRWIAGGAIVYGLFTRWLMIKQRRIALHEAIEERRLRREAAATGEPAADDPENPAPTDDDQVQLDLDAVVHQTRHLARSLVGIGVIVGLSHGVVTGLPIEHAGEGSFLANLPWMAMLRSMLVVLVTVTMVKNLPGFLDLAGLRGSGMPPGSRYALAKLCQYALIAIGFLIVATELQFDWSRFGWIAAALSVGLGFGLQEIVANLVCGIILLFEQPIRAGDVVTVGDVTGTVSKIRMRATTITNYEQQEFVVPNKEFITGSLINWTLSSTLNRIVIPVGVAYGTDTKRARQILVEIAEAHPHVLPDPPPSAVFEAFGDSTLDLVLRCFLPSLECRIGTITELHEEIDRRFAEEGIEIAFPQRDLHLRTIPDSMKADRS